MAKLRTKLTEMTKTDVQYVSLVKRAANRIPFRVIKSDKENGMLDLGKLGLAMKSESKKQPEGPTIAAVVVMERPEEQMKQVTKALADQGFSVDKVTKSDGTVIFAQEDGDLTKDAHVVRVSEDMLVVMKGFSPYSEEMDKNADFSEVVATKGFYQTLDVASSAFRELAYKSLYSAKDPGEAATAIRKAGEKFIGYVESLANGLPAKAFKADFALAEVIETFEDPDDDEEATRKAEGKEMTDEEKLAAARKLVKEADDAAAEKAKKDGEAGEGKAGDGEKEEAKKADAQVPDIKALLAEMVPGIVTAVKGEFDAFSKSITERVDQIARKSDDAANATAEMKKTLESTVLNGAPEGDRPAGGSKTQKNEDDDPRTGAFDTAFLRR